MVVGEAVFEAVRPVALLAEHARHEWGVDEGLAGRVGALLFVGEDVGFGRGRVAARGLLVGLRSSSRPFAGSGAFVRGFRAVVEAELAGEICWLCSACISDLQDNSPTLYSSRI